MTPEGAPTAAVVVSTFTRERKDWVLDALRSALDQTRRPDEVLLVLDPAPGLREAFEGAVPEGVRVVTSPRRGLSAARNAGVRATGCDVVAFLDDDAIAHETWLERLLRHYDDPRVVAAGGYAAPRWLDGRPGWFPAELNWTVGCTWAGHPAYGDGGGERAGEAFPVRNLIGCNMSFRRESLVDAGLFDESVGRRGKRLVTAEETEMCLRVARREPDARILYDPAAVVRHRVPRHRLTLAYVARRALGEGACKALIARRLKADAGGDDGLSDERDYLRFILKDGVAGRLARAATLRQPVTNVAQATVLLGSALVTGLGYLGGKTIAR